MAPSPAALTGCDLISQSQELIRMNRTLWIFTLVAVWSVQGIAEEDGFPTAKDVSRRLPVPTPVDAIPLEKLKTLAARDPGAEYDPNRFMRGEFQQRNACWIVFQHDADRPTHVMPPELTNPLW